MNTKKILFFYPANKRTVAIETSMLELKKRGYEILLLTTSSKGDLHSFLETQGIASYALQPAGYLKQIFLLRAFCKTHRINYVFSHLQQVNFVAVLAQFFVKAKIIIFRHHLQSVHETDEKIEVHPNELRMDKMINKLAKKIVVPSSGVYNGMLQYEKVNADKLLVIPYIYDFSKYQLPNVEAVEQIRKEYSCSLLLIMVSRMIRLKRHHVVLPVLKELINKGYDIKMILLDLGPEKENLENYVNANNLGSNVFFLGYRTDFVNYMAASDLLIQPSLTDASNSAAKEMALFEKPVAVSEGVGDYSDYVVNNKNGYLIPVTESGMHVKNIIVDAYNNQSKLKRMGAELKKEVISRFDSMNAEKIMQLYESLLD